MQIDVEGRKIIVTDRESYAECFKLEEGEILVTALSAWKSADSEVSELRNIVEFAISHGCKYYECLGLFAEELHDSIDIVIDDFEEGPEKFELQDILTSWTSVENIEDTANLFLQGYITDEKKISNGVFLVITSDADKDNNFVSLLMMLGGE